MSVNNNRFACTPLGGFYVSPLSARTEPTGELFVYSGRFLGTSSSWGSSNTANIQSPTGTSYYVFNESTDQFILNAYGDVKPTNGAVIRDVARWKNYLVFAGSWTAGQSGSNHLVLLNLTDNTWSLPYTTAPNAAIDYMLVVGTRIWVFGSLLTSIDGVAITRGIATYTEESGWVDCPVSSDWTNILLPKENVFFPGSGELVVTANNDGTGSTYFQTRLPAFLNNDGTMSWVYDGSFSTVDNNYITTNAFSPISGFAYATLVENNKKKLILNSGTTKLEMFGSTQLGNWIQNIGTVNGSPSTRTIITYPPRWVGQGNFTDFCYYKNKVWIPASYRRQVLGGTNGYQWGEPPDDIFYSAPQWMSVLSDDLDTHHPEFNHDITNDSGTVAWTCNLIVHKGKMYCHTGNISVGNRPAVYRYNDDLTWTTILAPSGTAGRGWGKMKKIKT